MRVGKSDFREGQVESRDQTGKLNVPEHVEEPIILTFSQLFPNFAPLPLLKFRVDPKFDHIPVCILLKFDCAKFGVC